MLYSFNNEYPKNLPKRIRLQDGSTKTDLKSMSKGDLESLGFKEAPVKPALALYQEHKWDGTNWTVSDLEVPKEHVNQERDRRISAGFTWSTKNFQSERDDRENINGAVSGAIAYLLAGGNPDELYWDNPNVPFMWLAKNNELIAMSPSQVIDFGKTMMAHKKQCIFAARTIKDMNPIPKDFTDDKYWP